MYAHISINMSVCIQGESAARSWKVFKYMSLQNVFTQIDTNRFVYLHVSINPATRDLSAHYHTPVFDGSLRITLAAHAADRSAWPL